MNTQDIIKSLSNLEKSLQGVESARQQVEKTVAAYSATQKQLSTLSQEFNNVSNELSSVIDVVRNNQEELSATLSSKIETLLVQIEDKVSVLGNKASVMNQTFESSCSETAKSINESVDAAIASFKEKTKVELNEVSSTLAQFNSTIEEIKNGFKVDSLHAVSTIQETGDKIVGSFQEKVESHLNSFSKLKVELENIVNLQTKLNTEVLTKVETCTAEIKANISDLDSQLKGIKNIIEDHHTESIDVLSSILQGNSLSAEMITTLLNTIDDNIGAVKDSISSVSSQVSTATSQIVDYCKQALSLEITDLKTENASIKKLLVVCLIVTAVSVVLNLLILFK